MTVEDVAVIDILGINKAEEVVLTISDHLDWSNEVDHLLTLQAKINKYLEFIENGEIFEKYPKAKGRKIVIEVIGKHEPPPRAKDFIEEAMRRITKAGFCFRFRLFAGGRNVVM